MNKIRIKSFKTELESEVTPEEFKEMEKVHGKKWKVIGKAEAPQEVTEAREKASKAKA